LLHLPLHRWRLVQRRYNRATLLCWALSNHCGHPASRACYNGSAPHQARAGVQCPGCRPCGCTHPGQSAI